MSSLGVADSHPDRFRALAAFGITFLALLLTVGSIGDANSTETAARENVRSADFYAFFQAKNIRQTAYKLAVDELESLLDIEGDKLDPALRSSLEKRVEEYRATIDRYESEADLADPDNTLKGEVKVQLLAQARNYERLREDARERGASFDYAQTFAQLGIVLMSAAILLVSWPLAGTALALGGASAVFLVNAFTHVADVPFVIG